MTHKHRYSDTQRGAVLIVALVLLLVLTVLGTASIRDTTMEERMAGNFRDHSVALEAAESALRLGEAAVSSSTLNIAMAWDGSDGTYKLQGSTISVDPEVDSNYGYTVSTIGGGSAAPEVFIEKLPHVQAPGLKDNTMGLIEYKVHYFRVTAKGYGVSPNAEVILQSTYFDRNVMDPY